MSLPWLRLDPGMSACEQRDELGRMADVLTDQHPGQDILVLVAGAGRGDRVEKSNGSRVLIRSLNAGRRGALRGLNPVAVFVVGFEPDERLLRELPEIVRWDIPCAARFVIANQPASGDGAPFSQPTSWEKMDSITLGMGR